MGRRPTDPLLQAAQGFPGRRRKKVESEIEAAAQAAASMPVTADNRFPVPDVFLKAPVYWKQAIKIWVEQSEVLRAAGRRRPGYRHALCRYCTWMQLFLTSSDQVRRDLPTGGAAVKVKKGDGETVIRIHPCIELMGKAETALRLLEAEFGFTPARDQELVKVEGFNTAQGKLPLGGQHPAQTTRGEPELDPFDLMNSSDSAPPEPLTH